MERTKRRWVATIAAAASTGVLFEMSCSPTELQVLMAGLEAASQALGGKAEEDVNFGDYLINELND